MAKSNSDVEPLEIDIQTLIRVAMHKAGVMVMRHHVDNRGQQACSACGYRDQTRGARTGLGIGVSDLVCIVPPHGRWLAIEVKRPSTRGNTSHEQQLWLAMVRRMGGVSGVATSVDEAMALLEEARRK